MPDRSKINGDNSRKHGLSQHPIYEVWRGITRNPFTLVSVEWHDVSVFVEDIESTIGPRPSPDHILIIKPGSDDEVFRKGNVEWYYRGVRMTRRARRAVQEKIDHGELLPGTPDPVPCLCWVSTEEPVCPFPECDCPWEARIDCPCCVGLRARLGMIADPETLEDL